ncbi:MAG: DUF1972 domain-containing protein [Crocinitomicaceae bacterium]|nr:DUF1972 domain-containing protein [Crocinitomicaceae bacterium]
MKTKRNKKRVAIVGTAGIPARYGGFETLAHHLVEELNDTYDFKVYASTKMYKKEERVKTFNKARVYYLPFSANGASSVVYDFISMIHAIFCSDIILILGVSGGLFVPFLRFFTNKKIVVNIDGMEWRRTKWSKKARAFLKFSERVAVRFSHADITDNHAIKRYTSQYYKTCSHYIAYGADHCLKVNLEPEDYKKYPFSRAPYAFKVARIEPENNVEMILKAFSNIPRKNLVVVGNWENSEYGKNLKSSYSGYKNIFLLDPIYNQVALDKLRSNCHVYIHGHSAGGTNPSLVEAMYLGLPVLAFDVSFNRFTTHNEAIYFSNAKELEKCIIIFSYYDMLRTSYNLKKIAKNFYTWDYIAAQYKSLFESFAFGYRRQKINSSFEGVDKRKLAQKGYAHLASSKSFYE